MNRSRLFLVFLVALISLASFPTANAQGWLPYTFPGNPHACLVTIGTVWQTYSTRYVALASFYVNNATASSTTIVFYFDNGFWSADALAYLGFLSSTPIVHVGMGDLFPQTVNIYSNSLYGSLNQTGYLYYHGNNYETIHDANICNSSSTLYPQWLGQYSSGGQYGIYRDLFYFDTRLVLKGVEIISATLYFTPYPPTLNITDPFDIVVQKSSSQNMPFTYSDWNAELYFGNYGQVSTNALNMSYSVLANSPYNMIHLNPLILNLGGITAFALRSSQDISDVAPTGTAYNYIYLYTYDYGIGQPYLKITYSADSEIVVYTNTASFQPIYINGVLIGYANDTTPILYPCLPFNATENNYYAVMFGPLKGYYTPNQIANLAPSYGNILTLTGVYYVVPPPTIYVAWSFAGVDIAGWVSGIIVLVLFMGVVGYVGRLVDYTGWGIAAGFITGFAVTAYAQIWPMAWFIIACFIMGGLIVMWIRGR